MVTENYTTRTAALKAAVIDTRILDARQITLKGKDILEYIGNSDSGGGTTTVKHCKDTREVITENDLWGDWIETKEDGTVIVHDDYVQSPNANDEGYAWNTRITKVENNKAFVGDTLFSNIQFEKVKNGSQMFYSCTALETVDVNLSSLMNGYRMFEYCSILENFTTDLSSLVNGYDMFYRCINLNTFKSNSHFLTNGGLMFYGCSNLATFTSDLSSLTNGYGMFNGCSNLTTFTSDLSSLTNGSGMFHSCTNLTTFANDLSSLVEGGNMFNYCNKLENFATDLSSLVNGSQMFQYCDRLTTFTADLGSLTGGNYMFTNTKLTPKSVMYIVNSIKDIDAEKKLYQDGIIPYVTLANGEYSSTKGFMSDGKYVYTYNGILNSKTPQSCPETITSLLYASSVGKLHIGINVTNDAATIADQLQAFAEGAYYDSWADLKQAFIDKGWTVTWQYGGTTTSITYDMRGERTIPCAVYTKLVEVEDKDQAEYNNEEGTKFYNIEWGHDVTHPQDFQQFDSIEDAMVAYGVILNVTETEE